MRMSDKQIQKLVQYVLNEMKSGNVIQLKEKEETILSRGVALVKAEIQKVNDLDKEVYRMMDDLERQNPGTFERYKMFPLLRKRLAKEKGVIL